MKVPLFAALFALMGATVAFTSWDRTEGVEPRPTAVAGAPTDPVALAEADPLATWVRPPGPLRIALQAGHWRASEAPDEQAGLRTNGTRGGGKAEWEVNLEIARRTARLLSDRGLEVEILPTTIPPGYWADVFVSIHADGHSNPSVSGYRAAAPRRDRTGKAQDLARLLDQTYGEITGLPHYPTVTRRMLNYYAFNSRRYEHALHPMTVGAILESGFLTSPADRRVIVNAPDLAARGIADAIVAFLETTPLDPFPAPPPAIAPGPERNRSEIRLPPAS